MMKKPLERINDPASVDALLQSVGMNRKLLNAFSEDIVFQIHALMKMKIESCMQQYPAASWLLMDVGIQSIEHMIADQRLIFDAQAEKLNHKTPAHLEGKAFVLNPSTNN